MPGPGSSCFWQQQGHKSFMLIFGLIPLTRDLIILLHLGYIGLNK